MSQTEILTATHGIAPRSDELLRLGTDVDRGRADHADFVAQLEQEISGWVATQTEAGIDLIENGKLSWQDHLRPLVKASSGFAPDVDAAPVTRWYSTNTFYRQPTITDRLRFDPDKFDEEAGPLGDQVSLVSPNTFAALCRNETTGLDSHGNVLQMYSELLFHLGQLGVRRVVLENYNTDSARALEGTTALADWESDIDVTLLNRSSEVVLPWSLRPNVSVEITRPTFKRLFSDRFRPDFAGGELWYSAVDSETTRPDELPAGEVRAILDLFKPARLVLTHTVDLERLPLPYAQAKVQQLGEFADDIKQRWEDVR